MQPINSTHRVIVNVEFFELALYLWSLMIDRAFNTAVFPCDGSDSRPNISDSIMWHSFYISLLLYKDVLSILLFLSMWIILNNFELLEKLYIATWQFPFTKSDYFSARGATRYLRKHKATSVNFCSIESLPA